MNILSQLFVFLSLLSSFCFAEELFHIEVSKVESRTLFGGLGSSGSIGEVTEFFISELDRPLVSIPGDRSSVFKNRIYIFKSGSYYVCPKRKLDDTCFKCDECLGSEQLETFKKFDIKNSDSFKKKIVKVMGTAGISKNQNINVDFIFPIKGEPPIELRVKIDHLQPNVDILLPFQYVGNLTSILKSVDDPAYYFCPGKNFSKNCLKCENCLEKIEKIKSFKPIN